LHDEPRKSGREAREDPTSGAPEEGNTLEDHLNLMNVIQQNAVIITGRKVKRDQSGPDKSSSERWL
jgi:hypothetical protein